MPLPSPRQGETPDQYRKRVVEWNKTKVWRMDESAPDDEAWRGIHKLQEEMAELGQVLAKITAMTASGRNVHWSGVDMYKALYEELGDVCAAVDYFVESNSLDTRKLADRRWAKLRQFRHWVLSGVRCG